MVYTEYIIDIMKRLMINNSVNSARRDLCKIINECKKLIVKVVEIFL